MYTYHKNSHNHLRPFIVKCNDMRICAHTRVYMKWKYHANGKATKNLQQCHSKVSAEF